MGASVVAISALSLWRTKTLAERELGVLSEPARRMAADWDARKVPLSQRVVNFVIADSNAGPDPFSEPPARDWTTIVSEWARSRLIGGKAMADSTSFVRTFSDNPAAVAWTYDGFSAASPEQMTREFEKALKIANEAGAEVNILAQGEGGAAALEALRRLQEVKTVQGVPVGANKVVLVGMSGPRLKKIPWVAQYDFSKLGNVLELANVYATGEMARQTRLEFAIPAGQPGRTLQEVWPRLAANGAGPGDEAKQVKLIFEPPEPMDKLVARQEQALRDEAARQEVEAQKAREEAARQAAEVSKAQEELARKQEEAQKAQEEARRREEQARQAAQAAKAPAQGVSAVSSNTTAKRISPPAAGRSAAPGAGVQATMGVPRTRQTTRQSTAAAARTGRAIGMIFPRAAPPTPTITATAAASRGSAARPNSVLC